MKTAMTTLACLTLFACSGEPATQTSNGTTAAPAANAAAPAAAPARPVSEFGVPTATPDGTKVVSVKGVNGQDITYLQNDLGLEVIDEGWQRKIVLPNDLLFDFDKDRLRPEATPTLEKAKQYLATHKSTMVQVWGHADAKGDDAYNTLLSQRRALAVSNWLKANGAGSFITAQGAGEGNPLFPNTKPDGSDNPEGRQKNRRVEIVMTIDVTDPAQQPR